MTEQPVDPQQTTEFLLGKLATKLDEVDRKLTELCDEMKEDKERRAELKDRVDGLEAWRDKHVEFHNKERDNIIISKSVFWALITAIIASGILFRVWEHLRG